MQFAVHSWPQGEVVISILISLHIFPTWRCMKWRQIFLHLTWKCARRLSIEGQRIYAWFDITVHFSGHPSGNWHKLNYINWPLKVQCSLAISPELFKPFTRPLWFLVVLLMASEFKMSYSISSTASRAHEAAGESGVCCLGAVSVAVCFTGMVAIVFVYFCFTVLMTCQKSHSQSQALPVFDG